MLDIEAHVLRYWESEFEELQPRKNRAGRRVYTEEDISTVRRIHHLLRVEKYTIEGAQKVMDEETARDATAQTREELLKLRAFLVNLRNRLNGS